MTNLTAANVVVAHPEPVQNARGSGRTALRGRWLILVRSAWVALAALALGLFIAGIPVRLAELHEQFQRHIGLSVYQNGRGEIVASPWSGSPAARVGVLERDVVDSADGEPLRGESGIASLEALAAGAIGTSINLGVRTGERAVRHYTLSLGGEEARPFGRLGLSFPIVAAYSTVVASLGAIVLGATSGLIVWRKTDDWLAMLVATTMLALVAGAAPVIALYRDQVLWQPVLDFLFALALTSLVLFFLLFPDGRFVPRWARLVGALGVVWLVLGPVVPQLYPWRMAPWPGLLTILGGLGVGVSAQIYRYQRLASHAQQQQTKWVVLGAALAALGLAGHLGIEVVGDRESPLTVLRDELATRPISQVLIGLLPVSIAVALFRYRLWDVDLIINRTLVYGLLTASVVAIYVIVIGSLGQALRVEGSPTLSLLAAGLVAILFEPLRRRLQRGVNRLLYGERDDPYAVLSRLSRRLGSTVAADAVLSTVVGSVRDALKLPYVAIAVVRGEGLAVAAASGELVRDALSLPLMYQDEMVGELRVGPRTPGEAWSSADRRLLEDLASQAGPAVHAARVTADLKQLTSELQAARERLVLTRGEERRRLRRDLHDELAPTLAALGLTAAAARDLVGPESAAGPLLIELHAGIRAAVGDIRRIAYELRPPVLDELGLISAIRERAARLDGRVSDAAGFGVSPRFQVTVDAPETLPLLPGAVEVAAYRIVQEALMNVVRHAQASRCHVRLWLEDGSLQLEVLDDGVGLGAASRAGVGLGSMRERAAELGGHCVVERRVPTGTRAYAYLPLWKEEIDGPAARTDRR